jgi:hypothetical protein
MRFFIATLLLASSLGASTWAGAQAAEQVHRSKDWVWNLSPSKHGLYYAATTNAAGHFIAVSCDPNVKGASCLYRAHFGLTCKEGDSYPALLNSTLGSAQLTLTCGNDNFFVLAPFDDVDKAVHSKGLLSIAVPYADGNSFSVSRFSTAGSTAAITGMSSALARDAESPQTSPQAAFVRL